MHMIKRIVICTMLIIVVAMVISCGNSSTDQQQIENGKNTVSAANGGTVTYSNEVKISIPENSLTDDVEISIEPINSVPTGGADGLEPFGQAYKFAPSGTIFELNSPAVLEIKYDETLLASKGYSSETLGLYYYDEEIGQYVAVCSYIDTVNKKIIALVEHFTIYLPMAKATLATNNKPYVALQNPIPNPLRAGSPIYVRTTVRDYDGSLSGVKLFYRKLQPTPGSWNQAVMKKEVRPNVLNTYGYTITSGFLSSSDLGAGNDIEYYVTAVDNLGATTTSPTRRFDITRTYNIGSLKMTPATLDIVAGFEQYFIVRGIDNLGTSYQLIPDNFSLTLDKGVITNSYASGLLFHAYSTTASGTSENLKVFVGNDTASSLINIYNGELTSIEILDTNSQKITSPIIIKKDIPYTFDAIGYDVFGNSILINPTWNSDASLGIIDSDGNLIANTASNTGKIYISLGNLADDQIIQVILDDNFKIDFNDTDEKTGRIGGNVFITKPDDEAFITSYILYWGGDNKTKLNGEPAIVNITKTGSNIIYNIPSNNLLPMGATHILCFVELGGIESAFFSSCPITDVIGIIGPTTGGSGILSVDSKTLTKLGISWSAAFDDITPSNQLEYSVYYSTNSNIDILTNAQLYGILSLDWTTDITSYEINGLNKNTSYYVAVFVRDSGGHVANYVKINEMTYNSFLIGWCRTEGDETIQSTLINGNAGDKKKIAGQVYAENATESSGANHSIRAQFGYGPAGNSCINNSQWTWSEATYIKQEGNNDWYRYELTLPTTGSYEYVFRFSGDGGATWTYADTYGTTNVGSFLRPFNPALQGKITVY